MSITHDTGAIPVFTRGDRFRKAREYAGYGVMDLAEALGLSRNTISNVEAERVAPRRVVTIAWSVATGLTSVFGSASARRLCIAQPMCRHWAMHNFVAIGVRDAVDILSMPKRTVIALVESGRLPAQKLSGRTGAYVFDRADVEAFAESRRPAGTDA